jgi:osmotically-inducible protein OsmY
MPSMGVVQKTDAEIQQDVLRELKWDSRVEETDVGVEVDQGIVTLSGTVSSWGKRRAAVEAAHRVHGVLDVANDITVRLPGTPGRTDTEIAAAVRHALEWNVFVPASRVRSTVTNGGVRLEGAVDTWAQSEDAEDAVRNLHGVRSVVNVIEVQPPAIDPAKVRKAIEEALERQAHRESNRISLLIHDGHVKVLGTVRTWVEKEAVMGAAKGTPGVRSVEEALRIDPSL